MEKNSQMSSASKFPRKLENGFSLVSSRLITSQEDPSFEELVCTITDTTGDCKELRFLRNAPDDCPFEKLDRYLEALVGFPTIREYEDFRNDEISMIRIAHLMGRIKHLP